MKKTSLQFKREFKVALTGSTSQVAEMVLKPGGTEGGPDNSHRGADQWLFVISGKGEAIVDKRTYPLKQGTLLLIEKRETHEIRNTGRTPLKTFNVYSPTAYTSSGEELPAGKPRK
jgi:mannose-6-phosphate isomerase-like protein (cupin superfamily)